MKNYIYIALLAAAAVLTVFMNVGIVNKIVIWAVCGFGILALLAPNKPKQN
jgi:hypothetical protein